MCVSSLHPLLCRLWLLHDSSLLGAQTCPWQLWSLLPSHGHQTNPPCTYTAQVCLSTVGVLGDVCRNVEEGILPYCDDLMSILINNLGREDVHRTIKPQILAAFGDIALVIADKWVACGCSLEP